MASKEFSFADVAAHASKKDLYMVIHDKVYDASAFVDEHPGGEEVMLDLGGQDASEAFEDVGHSDEAREILNGMLVGEVKRGEGDPPKKSYSDANTSAKSGAAGDATGLGIGVYAFLIVGVFVAFTAYTYLQKQQSQK